MRWKRLMAIAAGGAAVALGGAAQAATMHPQLGAKLSGMGEHGIVNLTSHASKGELCWTFTLGTKGITHASVRDAHGMVVAKLGTSYKPKACAMVAKTALHLIEATPKKYWVWVDTKGHPGDLRGRLFAGMAHM